MSPQDRFFWLFTSIHEESVVFPFHAYKHDTDSVGGWEGGWSAVGVAASLSYPVLLSWLPPPPHPHFLLLSKQVAAHSRA